MEPIIYVLPVSNQIKLDKGKFHYENNPSPKLLKYGFNNMTEQLDLESITIVPQYQAALGFGFEKKNENMMISSNMSEFFKISDVDVTFVEFWEILILFGFLTRDQNIYTSHPKTIEDVTKTFQSTSGSKYNYQINGKNTTSLVVFKYGDSNVEVDENAGIQLLSNNLEKLLTIQDKGASMILQLFGLQTQISAEIVYYLSSLYNEAYLIKPLVISELSNSRYIVLKDLKELITSIPKFNSSSDTYLTSIGLKPIPIGIDNIIQCMNSFIMPIRQNKYYQIKKYMNTKVYEGGTYHEMIHVQNQNINNWTKFFSNFDNMNKIFDQSLKKSMSKCTDYQQLLELLV